MGIEFIRKRAKSYTRRWDLGRLDLGTCDLFTQEPTAVPRVFPFDLAPAADVHVGDTVVVESDGNVLIARNRLSEVARSENPPNEILTAVRDSCGVAKGFVHHVHCRARVAEISLC